MAADRLNVVVPLKGGSDAKSRLSPVASPQERRLLWLSMADHVLSVLAAMTPPPRRFVVSACPDAALLAARRGATVIFDSRRSGAAAAYEQALERLPEDEPVLLLNGDLPALRAADVGALVGDLTRAAIAPDRRRTGTNALFLPASARFPPQFGLDSFARHRAAAEAAALPYRIVERLSLASDVDDPDDLAACASLPPHTLTDARGPRWRTD